MAKKAIDIPVTSGDLSAVPFPALVAEMIRRLGDDPDREGMIQTPERVEEALRFLTQGYADTGREVVGDALFTECHGNMVLVKDIEMYSMCEHHLLPFFGKVHVAYIPEGQIMGLSKVARLVDVYAPPIPGAGASHGSDCRVALGHHPPTGGGRGDRSIPPVHDDAWCAEAELEDDHVCYARQFSGGSPHSRRIPPPRHLCARAAVTGIPLAGHTALVTGASRGIGAAVALHLAGAGAQVQLLARSADVLVRMARELGRERLARPTSRTRANFGGCLMNSPRRWGVPPIWS